MPGQFTEKEIELIKESVEFNKNCTEDFIRFDSSSPLDTREEIINKIQDLEAISKKLKGIK